MNSSFPSYEELEKLAQSDPEHLESLRAQWIEDVIDRAQPEMRHRLRGLQFQIDCQRRLHKNPLGACIEISRMMYASLNNLNKLMNESRSDYGAEPNAESAANVGRYDGTRAANIIAFPSPLTV